MPQQTLSHSPCGLLELLAPSAAPWPAQGLKPRVNDEYVLLSGSSRVGGHHTSKLFSATKVNRNLHFLKYRWDLMIKLNCRKKNPPMQEPLLACLLESRSWSFQKSHQFLKKKKNGIIFTARAVCSLQQKPGAAEESSVPAGH